MLSKIRVRGFRALKDVTIELPARRPLVLIGENASGKSSLLDALALIAAFARGEGGDALYARGGWSTVAWQGTAQSIEFELEFERDSHFFAPDAGRAQYSLALGVERGVPTVQREQLGITKDGHEQPLIVLQGGPRAFVKNQHTGSNDPVSPSVTDRLARGLALAAAPTDDRYPTVQHMRSALASIASYAGFALQSSAPLSIAQVEHTPRIARDGRNLLAALHTMHASQERWEDFINDVRAVFPWLDALSFPPVPTMRGYIGLQWRDRRSGTQLNLEDMSDGMRVYLATLAALHADDDPAVIAMDEPERSLHPKALQRAMTVVEARSERSPVMLATHSDRLLDFLSSPAESLAICRFDDSRGVTVDRIAPEVLNEWLQDYSLSELRKRRSFDAARLRVPSSAAGDRS